MRLITLVLPCFNGGNEALASVNAVGRLKRPSDVELEAIIVDDASTDGSTTALAGLLPPWARLLRAPENLGRSGAINMGVQDARGELLLILDCDCVPSKEDFLLEHLTAIVGADASIGDIQGHVEGFWGRYQSDVARRRSQAAATDIGGVLNMTTQNMLLTAAAFQRVGGFDQRYRQYGFEDRDLLLRLHSAGATLRHAPKAVVTHGDNLDLPTICRKMRQSGRYSAPLFRSAHPVAYARLGYAKVDANLHPARSAMLVPLVRFVVSRADQLEGWLQRDYLPYQFRARIAQLAAGLAFLSGTLDDEC